MSEHTIEVDPKALQRCAKALKESAGPVGAAGADLPESYAGSWPSGLIPGAEALNEAVTKLLTALKTDADRLRTLLEDGERTLDQAQTRYSHTGEQISDDARKVAGDVGADA